MAVFLHSKKDSITLTPLYAYVAILTVLTHNLSDLGFKLVLNDWVFIVSSFSMFTTLMFCILLLYLFEGPRAGRFALWIILFSSFFYIGVVFFLGFITDTSSWILIDSARISYYFWSILAIIIDVIFLAIAWEVLSRATSLNLLLRVFVIIFGVFALDTLIFTTGVFGTSEMYLSILQGNLLMRLALSAFGAPVMAYFLIAGGFSEDKRDRPKSVLEILNFQSDLGEKKTF